MANGNTALLTLAPDPPPAVIDPKPASEIRHRIAEAVADAVAAMAAGVVDWAEAEAMSPATRELNGETLGAVTMLLLDNPDALPDFGEVAFTEGRKVLLARLGAGLHQHRCGAALVDELLNGVVGIAERVARSELALRAN